jgi:hypothetical protein
MKLKPLMVWLSKLVSGERNTEKLQLLQHQRILLRQGLEGTAEIIDTSVAADKIGNMLPVRLWLKLKITDGSFIFTHTKTLLQLRQVPVKGQVVRIKYLPENLSSVLVL